MKRITTFSLIVTAIFLLALANAPLAGATYPGKNGKLVFAQIVEGCCNELYTSNADGSGLKRLTFLHGDSYSPKFSPNGTKIVFAGDPGNRHNHDIYVMNSDGSLQTNLTNTPEVEITPQWFSNGSQILFRRQINGVYQNFVMDADGSNIEPYAGNPYRQVSPDGQKVAFIKYSQENGRDYERLYVANMDGSDENLISGDIPKSGIPQWSPDGTALAFTGGEYPSEIYTVKPDGTSLMKLTTSPPSSSGDVQGNLIPVWSPDGRKIAFMYIGPQSSRLFTMNADGSNVTPVTTPNTSDTYFNGAMDWQAVAPPLPDTTSPTTTLLINAGKPTTMTPSVKLTLNARDTGSGLSQMRFKNSGSNWSKWKPYAKTSTWRLAGKPGTKAVSSQVRDEAGNVSKVATDKITYRR